MTTAPEHEHSGTDFMTHGFSLITEPLNLTEDGQRWFLEAARDVTAPSGSCGLVLGATAWAAGWLARRHSSVLVIDRSAAMLQMARDQVARDPEPAERARIQFVAADWLDLPADARSLGTVIGDNSLLFMRYPDHWLQLRDRLAERMLPGACLLLRVVSVPRDYRAATATEIASRFHDVNGVSWTEVRTNLLFSQWDRTTYAIDTESVVAQFDSCVDQFRSLLSRHDAGVDNDLMTVEKYRGSGAVYYAPPLEEILAMLRGQFSVVSVRFGPYAMSDHFPLVECYRR